MLRIVLILLTLAAPAWARPLSDDEHAGLLAQLDTFTAAMIARDWHTVGATVPPRVLALMGANVGETADAAREAMIGMMSHQMMQVTVDRVGFDPKNLDAIDGTVDDAPVVQTFVPFDWTFTLRGQQMSGRSPTLALLDGGTWYLLRIETADQRAMLNQAYPFLADVEFPE